MSLWFDGAKSQSGIKVPRNAETRNREGAGSEISPPPPIRGDKRSVEEHELLSTYPIFSSPDVLQVANFIAHRQAEHYRTSVVRFEARRHSFFGRVINWFNGTPDLLRNSMCEAYQLYRLTDVVVGGMDRGRIQYIKNALVKTGLVERVTREEGPPFGGGLTSEEGFRIRDRRLFDAVI